MLTRRQSLNGTEVVTSVLIDRFENCRELMPIEWLGPLSADLAIPFLKHPKPLSNLAKEGASFESEKTLGIAMRIYQPKSE